MKAEEFVKLVRSIIMSDDSGEEDSMMAQELFSRADTTTLLRELAKKFLPGKNYLGLKRMGDDQIAAASQKAANSILAEGTKLASARGMFSEDLLGRLHFAGSKKRRA